MSEPDDLYIEAMTLLRRAQELLERARQKHELVAGQAQLNAQLAMRQQHKIRELERMLVLEAVK